MWHGFDIPMLTRATAVIIDAAVKGAALLLLAWAATLLMQRASAAARSTVWRLALLGLVALPLACALLPGWISQ